MDLEFGPVPDHLALRLGLVAVLVLGLVTLLVRISADVWAATCPDDS
ncbi:hypothetical protein [Pseudonocardia humida]|uniref:Uncharacterized protein n=1 Tax=Pseudonocardia humida TaxID=2800819 RepID=A0ABT1ADU5_9PSEU|nr:hypothetical protein [Pseudonocardia humida]MCO1661113.1 hypothetical protein [Pseudonocardia humida]